MSANQAIIGTDSSLSSGELLQCASSPSGGDIFCLKNIDTFTRTPVGVLKINIVARAQLTFQILALLKNFFVSFLESEMSQLVEINCQHSIRFNIVNINVN